MSIVYSCSQRKLRSGELRYLDWITWLMNSKAGVTAMQGSEHRGEKQNEKVLATTSRGLGWVPSLLWASITPAVK